MPAEAANGLGLEDSAAAYYKRALVAGKEFGCGGLLSCDELRGAEAREDCARRVTCPL